jgi:hypothetical protein
MSVTPASAQASTSGSGARSSSRSSPVTGLLTPPGTAPVPWTRLPAVMRMHSWPNLRRPMPWRARSGWAAKSSTTLRSSRRGVEAEQQVWRRQVEEVQGVRLQDLAVVHEPPDPIGGRGQRGRADHRVEGLGGGQVVADRADPAQPLHHHRHLPVRPPDDEPLEAAELDDVQPHLMDAVSVVEEDRHLAVALDPRHRLDHDAAQGARVGGGVERWVHRGLREAQGLSRT